MKPLLSLLIFAWVAFPLLAADSAAKPAPDAPSLSKEDEAFFSIIPKRNIFNPNRSRGSSNTRKSEETSTERAPKTESFSLLGTMSYDKGDFAFFASSRSDMQKAYKPGDTIAGYTIKDIAPNSVVLEGNGKTNEMKVGYQMKRQEQGEWTLSEGPRMSATTSRSGSSGSASTPDKPPTDAEAEILKRMMERRAQEMKNEK